MTIYDNTKKISPDLNDGKLLSVYRNVASILECFHDQRVSSPVMRESMAKAPNQGLARWAKFFLSFFFRQAGSIFEPSNV